MPAFFSWQIEPVLFFLCQKEKNGFNLPRKERGHSADRSPEFDSKDLGLPLSVAPVPTTRKVSALCASPFGVTFYVIPTLHP